MLLPNWIDIPLTIISILGVISLVAYTTLRYRHRNDLFIGAFADAYSHPVDIDSFIDLLRKHMNKLSTALEHSDSRITGTRTSLKDSPIHSESYDLKFKITNFFSGEGVPFIRDLIPEIMKRWTISGSFGKNAEILHISANLKRGDDKIADEWDLNVDPYKPNFLDLAAEQLAYRIILDISRGDLFGPQLSMGTDNWEAFCSYTKGVTLNRTITPKTELRISDEEKNKLFVEIDFLYSEALKADPTYAAAIYNRANLYYSRLESSDLNDEALAQFRLALEIAIADVRESGAINANEIAALSWWGISRCYSQRVHRFNDGNTDNQEKALHAARQAIKLLPNDTRVRSGEAFAIHCTENFGDLIKGREIYEKIERETGDIDDYPIVLNNYAYVVMKLGEYYDEQGPVTEVKPTYDKAIEIMLRARIAGGAGSTTWRLASANLGNIARINNQYSTAVNYYHEALLDKTVTEDNPNELESSRYTNGFKELSRVYYDMGQFEQTVRFHYLALKSTGDTNIQSKIITELISWPGIDQFSKTSELGVAVAEKLDSGVVVDTQEWNESLASALYPSNLTPTE